MYSIALQNVLMTLSLSFAALLDLLARCDCS